MGTDVQDLTARAKRLISERRYQEAVRVCRRVLLSRPDEVEVRLLLGMALLALRRYDEVRAEMMALTRKVPRRPEVHRLLGEAYLRSGQSEKAAASLRRALEIDPGDMVASELLSELGDESHETGTIDRWFDPAAVATTEVSTPELIEEELQHTTATSTSSPFDQEQSTIIVADDAYVSSEIERASRLHDDTTDSNPPLSLPGGVGAAPAQGGRPRRKPTMLGLGGLGAPSAAPSGSSTKGRGRISSIPPPPPPGAKSGPANGRGRISSIPPPPSAPRPSGPPPPAPRPRVTGTSVSEDSTFRDTPTTANRPMAIRSRPSPPAPPREETSELHLSDIEEVEPPRMESTDELSLSDIEEAERRPVAPMPEELAPAAPWEPGGDDPLDVEPTRALPPAQAPFDDLEGIPTRARNVASVGLPPLEAAPTIARVRPGDEDVPTGRRANPSFPPPGVSAGAFPGRSGWAGRSGGGRTTTISRASGKQAFLTAMHSVLDRTGTLIDRARSSFDSARAGAGRQRLPLRIALVAIPVLLVLVTFVGVHMWLDHRAEKQVVAAVQAASRDGLPGSLQQALKVASDRGGSDSADGARLARLYATAALEQGSSKAASEALLYLQHLDSDGASLPDAHIAKTYLALSKGNVDAAWQAASTISVTGGPTAEGSHARALSAAAMGDIDRAVVEARTALLQEPKAARYAASFAVLSARHGDVPHALQALDQVQNGPLSPAVRIARARVLFDTGRDPERAIHEADAVLGDLAALATPPQKAWAHLLKALRDVSIQDDAHALTEAKAAEEGAPPGDEGFGLDLAQAFLAAGSPKDAGRVLDQLPSRSGAPPSRARLVARVALARHQIDAADRALAGAGEGPRVDYLRGRVAEARGHIDEARGLYQRAAEDPAVHVPARVQLASLELKAGHSQQALDLLADARDSAPTNVDLVLVLVRAYLEQHQPDQAHHFLQLALQRHASSSKLQILAAQVDLAQGHADTAYTALHRLVATNPDDASLQSALGEAARQSGHTDEAHSAFEKALHLDPHDVRSLLGLGQLAIDAGDADAAQAVFERATQSGVHDPRLDSVHGQVLMLQGAGDEAAAVLKPLAEEANTASLWAAFGRALTQAERDSDARSAFRKALHLDPHNPEAQLGNARIEIRGLAFGQAGHAIDDAERDGRARHLGDVFEARVWALRGLLAYNNGQAEPAKEDAQKALAKDPACAYAHFVLAQIAIDGNQDPIPELRKAAQGHTPAPEVLGMLAKRLGHSDEACQLAHHYMQIASTGVDAHDVSQVVAGCS